MIKYVLQAERKIVPDGRLKVQEVMMGKATCKDAGK